MDSSGGRGVREVAEQAECQSSSATTHDQGWLTEASGMVPGAEYHTVAISTACFCWRDCVNLPCECRSGWSCKFLPGWDDNSYLNLCPWPWQGVTYWIPREAFISPASLPAVSEQGSCFRTLCGDCEFSGHFLQQLRGKPHVSLAYGVREKEITKLVSYQPRHIQDILFTSSARGLVQKASVKNQSQSLRERKSFYLWQHGLNLRVLY